MTARGDEVDLFVLHFDRRGARTVEGGRARAVEVRSMPVSQSILVCLKRRSRLAWMMEPLRSTCVVG